MRVMVLGALLAMAAGCTTAQHLSSERAGWFNLGGSDLVYCTAKEEPEKPAPRCTFPEYYHR